MIPNTTTAVEISSPSSATADMCREMGQEWLKFVKNEYRNDFGLGGPVPMFPSSKFSKYPEDCDHIFPATCTWLLEACDSVVVVPV